MGIAILTLDHLMARLGGAVEALLSRGARPSPTQTPRAPAGVHGHSTPSQAASHASVPAPRVAVPPSSAASDTASSLRPHVSHRRPAAAGQGHRPVRIVHIADSRSGRRTPGRLVISGRMADVCAELGRLAAQEALAH